MKKITIAIDGFSSSGKSTMAKELAKTIGYHYVDSGAMYRAVTYYALQHDMIHDGNPDVEAIERSLPGIAITFASTADGQHALLNGVDVEREIRGIKVSQNVSAVAAIPAVRRALVSMQQSLGKDKGIVMDGRDIGTTVFPDAELKIYVNAPAETRAHRRFNEMMQKGDMSATYEDVLSNVRQRDHLDMTRSESPLRRAEDAIDLDNSMMSLDDQNRWLLEQYRKVVGEL